MARIRTIKPEFFLDEQIAEKLTYQERLLWIGLWCLADREGRLEDRPKYIKSQVFPYDTLNIEAALQKLHENGYIVRYAIDKTYIQIKNFLKYQRPYHKEPQSEIPLPVIAASSSGHDREKNAGLGNGSMDYGSMDNRKGSNGGTPNVPVDDSQIKQIFTEYHSSWNRDPKYLLTPERRNWIRQAILIHGVEKALSAVKAFRADEWEDRIKHNGLEYLFGDRKKIDKWCLMGKVKTGVDWDLMKKQEEQKHDERR